jgi:hypothetical protein
MFFEDDLLTRFEDGVLSMIRLVHEANLTVLGALGDSLPTPPWVDIVPSVPRLLNHSFRFTSLLLDLQRHYSHAYLEILGAPEPAEPGPVTSRAQRSAGPKSKRYRTVGTPAMPSHSSRRAPSGAHPATS